MGCVEGGRCHDVMFCEGLEVNRRMIGSFYNSKTLQFFFQQITFPFQLLAFLAGHSTKKLQTHLNAHATSPLATSASEEDHVARYSEPASSIHSIEVPIDRSEYTSDCDVYDSLSWHIV